MESTRDGKSHHESGSVYGRVPLRSSRGAARRESPVSQRPRARFTACFVTVTAGAARAAVRERGRGEHSGVRRGIRRVPFRSDSTSVPASAFAFGFVFRSLTIVSVI